MLTLYPHKDNLIILYCIVMDTLKNFNNSQHAVESNWLNIAESQYMAVNHKTYAHLYLYPGVSALKFKGEGWVRI